MSSQQPALDELFYDTCQALEESIAHVQSPNRRAELCIVRCIFCFVAYLYTNYSVKEIGFIMGGRDHTTAINQRDVAINLLDTKNTEFLKKFEQYKERSVFFRNMKVIRLPRKFNL